MRSSRAIMLRSYSVLSIDRWIVAWIFNFGYLSMRQTINVTLLIFPAGMMGSLGWATVLAIVLCTIGVRSNYPPPERLTGMNPCISKQTCHECIQTPHCAWCAAPVSPLNCLNDSSEFEFFVCLLTGLLLHKTRKLAFIKLK